MKLSPEARRMLWDVHGVAGVLSSLILFVAFFAGTLTVFHGPIRAWERPSLRGIKAAPEPESIDALIAPFLAEHRPGARPPSGGAEAGVPSTRLRVGMPGEGRATLDVWTVRYDGDARLDEHEAAIDLSAAAPIVAEQTAVADFLYGLHYHLAIPFDHGGRYVYWLFGLAAVVGLLVVVSGLVFHLRLLAVQFFQFRPRLDARTLWTDAHKVLGVLGLPYWLMYLFTGAWFPFAGLLIALLGATAFRGADGGAREVIHANAQFQKDPSGRSAPMLGFDALRDRARAAWPELEVEAFDVRNYGDEHAYCRVRGAVEGRFLHRGTLLLDPITGFELGRDDPAALGFAERAQQTIGNLHFANFGGPALRWCYFILGVGGCLCIVSGTLVWVELRRKATDRPRPLATDRWLAPTTVGVCLGLCVATAALFLANKLLPASLADRPWWEPFAFWVAWSLAGLHALARRPLRLASRDLFAAAALLTLAIPVVNALATGDHPLRSIASGRWGVAGVDLTASAIGLAFGLTAVTLSGARPAEGRATGRRATARPVPAEPAEADGPLRPVSGRGATNPAPAAGTPATP